MKKKLHLSPLFNKRGDARFSRSIRKRKLKKLLKTQNACIYLSGDFNINSEISRKKLMNNLKSIRNLTASNIPVNLSFMKVSAPVDPCGMMLVISEVSKIQEEYPQTPIKYLRPNSSNEESNTILNQLLEKFGLVTKEFSRKSDEHELVRQWEYIYGSDASYTHIEQKEFIKLIRDRIATIFSKEPASISRHLYNSVSEAATNVANHAYIDRRPIKNERCMQENQTKWWTFKAEFKDKEEATTGFSVLICDRGVGIPYSLLQKYDNPEEKRWTQHLTKGLKKIGRSLTSAKDSDLIKLAIEYGKTRTEANYRGRGLPQIIKTIQTAPNAKVRIYSNKGLCELACGPDGEFKINRKIDFKTSILGTIIYWYLPIN